MSGVLGMSVCMCISEGVLSEASSVWFVCTGHLKGSYQIGMHCLYMWDMRLGHP